MGLSVVALGILMFTGDVVHEVESLLPKLCGAIDYETIGTGHSSRHSADTSGESLWVSKDKSSPQDFLPSSYFCHLSCDIFGILLKGV